MAKFKCDKCGYETNDKRYFDNHNNRKIPCFFNNAKLHGNTKNTDKTDDLICKHCDQSFSRHDSLMRHIKSQHATINGDHNNANINSHNTTNTNNFYKPVTINQTNIIIPFTDYNISDLTIFEQYKTLTSEVSPYTSILDHYNLNPNRPQYHNMHLGNINKTIMDVHDGTKWKKETIASTLNLLVPTHQELIGTLLNRFRIFLNIDALKLIPHAIYYGSAENLKYYKIIVKEVKLHLYNNRLKDHVPDLNVPEDRNDKIFWAVSKNFDWPEVEDLMTELDKYKIDLDQNLDLIKNQILESKMKTTTKNDLYKKLIKRIGNLITTFKTNANKMDDSGSSSDTLSSDSCRDSNSDSEKDCKKSKKHSSNGESDSEPTTYLKKKIKNYKNESDKDPKIYPKKNEKKIKKKFSDDESDESNDKCDSNSSICPKKINKKSQKNSSDNESDSNPSIYPKKINKKSQKKSSDNESDSNLSICSKKINKKSQRKSSDNESDSNLSICSKKKSKKSISNNYPGVCSKKISKKYTTSSDSEPDISPNEIRKKIKNEFPNSNFDSCPKKFRIKKS